MKYLFIDIDGVVNSTAFFKRREELKEYKELSFPLDSFDKDAISLLNYIIDNTDAKIVISSDWRFDEDLIPCLKYHGLKYEIYGITPYDKHYRRGIEIQKFLLNEKDVETYCIIDDIINHLLPTQYDYIVHTSFSDGLTKELADKAIKILNNEM